jgi:hypothetical protein
MLRVGPVRRRNDPALALVGMGWRIPAAATRLELSFSCLIALFKTSWLPVAQCEQCVKPQVSDLHLGSKMSIGEAESV